MAKKILKACLYFYRVLFYFGLTKQAFFLYNRNIYIDGKIKKEFYWTILTHFCVIPFYILCIFFLSRAAQGVRIAVVFLSQFLVRGIYVMVNSLKNAKIFRREQEALRRQLEGQQKKEEMGKWK